MTPTTPSSSAWVNRQGTFLRVLIVNEPDQPTPRSFDDIDITIHRILVVSACTTDQLHTSTERLVATAHANGVRLIPADGHHDCLLERITALNARKDQQ